MISTAPACALNRAMCASHLSMISAPRRFLAEPKPSKSGNPWPCTPAERTAVSRPTNRAWITTSRQAVVDRPTARFNVALRLRMKLRTKHVGYSKRSSTACITTEVKTAPRSDWRKSTHVRPKTSANSCRAILQGGPRQKGKSREAAIKTQGHSLKLLHRGLLVRGVPSPLSTSR